MRDDDETPGEPKRRPVPSLEMWRERRQLTSGELARIAGGDVSEAAIARWESGAEHPSLPSIRALARVLGVDPWELSRPPYIQRSARPDRPNRM